MLISVDSHIGLEGKEGTFLLQKDCRAWSKKGGYTYAAWVKHPLPKAFKVCYTVNRQQPEQNRPQKSISEFNIQ